MKRIMILMLVCLLLCGCNTEHHDETVPAETSFADPTEPSGCYEPDSEVERKTGGAVRAYPLNMAGNYALACMGGDIVVFSGNMTTTLTKLTGDNLYAVAQKDVGEYIDPLEPSTQITQKGISYFSRQTGDVVLLDTNFKEVARFPAPEGMIGTPVLSENRQMLYYCTGDAIRVLDTSAGISRMLKGIAYPEQSIEGLFLGDSILQCSLFDGASDTRALFISTETGEMLWEGKNDFALTATGDSYYAIIQEGVMQTLVYGQPESDAQMLIPGDLDAKFWFAEALNGVVTVSGTEAADATLLAYYDLNYGMRTSSVELTGCGYPGSVIGNGTDGKIYLLCRNDTEGEETIYCWDTEALPSEDETVYTGARYTADHPDTEGLEACRTYAREIEKRYGVRILIGSDAVADQPWDYTMEIEYQVPLIRRDLELLDQALGNYPEGLFKTAAAATPSDVLTICLVRKLQGRPQSGSLDTAEGTQYWVDENAYIALGVGQNTERNLYHEMFHVIETKVLSDCTAYYEWEKLNPEGFEYDYDYAANQNRVDDQYLEDKTRAFIDSYSMSFPKEDRARIMEYAMISGNESFFQSETMQKKLHQLCLGIRQAFDLENVQEEFLWEQYLDTSFAEAE